MLKLKSFQRDLLMEQGQTADGLPGMVTSSMTAHIQIEGSPEALEELSAKAGLEFIGWLASALGISSSAPSDHGPACKPGFTC
jgi:hypothetical protein